MIRSSQEVEVQLDKFSSKLSSSKGSSVIALAKFVRAWATAANLVRKELNDRLRDIDDEKASILGYDSANEDRHDAMHDALVSLRQRIYPVVTILACFLTENDPTKHEAQSLLDAGLNLVPDAALQRGCIPEVDEVSA